MFAGSEPETLGFRWGKKTVEIGAAGFEPTTPTTPKWCATKLRHAPSDLSYHSASRRLSRLSNRVVSWSLVADPYW